MKFVMNVMGNAGLALVLASTVMMTNSFAATKESIEKEALATHPDSTITSMRETKCTGKKRKNKKAWEVEFKDSDGRSSNAYYDADSGKLIECRRVKTLKPQITTPKTPGRGSNY